MDVERGTSVGLIFFCQLNNTSWSHLGRRKLNLEDASIRMTCEQAYGHFLDHIDVEGPQSLWVVPPLG